MDRANTIAAISTPPGAGGIGIVRVSGGDSLRHLRAIFQPHAGSCSFDSHRLYYGKIAHPESRKVLDEEIGRAHV